MFRYSQHRRSMRVFRRSFTSGTGDGKDDWWGSKPSTGSVFDDVEISDSTPSKPPPEPIARKSSLFTAAPVRREPQVDGVPKLPMSQALYLAKEAGIFTTREIQTHFVKSPSFSRDTKSPFLLEDFFTTPEEGAMEAYSADFKKTTSVVTKSTSDGTTTSGDSGVFDGTNQTDVVPDSIHRALTDAFNPNSRTFGARGREWQERAEGKGTRKRSVAHVVIERGTGIIKVNGEEDFFKRWPLLYNRFDVVYPFQACNAAGLFDVYISVKGGGISGQAGAARLAVGRALVAACPQCEDDLKDSLVLYEDTRQRTSKFPGKTGAYSRHNWTLR